MATRRIRRSLVAALASVVVLGASPVLAGQYFDGVYTEPSDRVYADSYGNLVVHSRTGYKRIVVGQGHLAAQMRAYTVGEAETYPADAPGAYDPEEEAGRLYGYRADGRPRQPCRKPAVILHGRGYMYGLADGEVPTPTGCY